MKTMSMIKTILALIVFNKALKSVWRETREERRRIKQSGRVWRGR